MMNKEQILEKIKGFLTPTERPLTADQASKALEGARETRTTRKAIEILRQIQEISEVRRVSQLTTIWPGPDPEVPRVIEKLRDLGYAVTCIDRDDCPSLGDDIVTVIRWDA